MVRKQELLRLLKQASDFEEKVILQLRDTVIGNILKSDLTKNEKLRVKKLFLILIVQSRSHEQKLNRWRVKISRSDRSEF